MISENKLKHMLGVARECRSLARQKDLSEDLCDAMFIMGFLHDIGYEDDESSSHGSVSEELVRSFESHINDCCDAIVAHGLVFDNWSVFDDVLNRADMTISHTGNKITMEERLEGIKERWGSESVHYRHACEVVNKLKELDSLNES